MGEARIVSPAAAHLRAQLLAIKDHDDAIFSPVLGRDHDCGVFCVRIELDPSHLTPVAAPAKRAATNFRDIYFFRGGSADGSAPDGVVAGPDGTLLGTTLDGGHIHPRDCKESGCGTIFQFDSLERPLYLFQPQPDAFHPLGTLLEHNGVYYGAAEGGAHGFGAIFSLSRNPSGNWVETTLYSFSGAPDGAQASGVVYVDARGNVFGTTRMGGTGTGCLFTNTGCGTFFELQPPAQSGRHLARIDLTFVPRRSRRCCSGSLGRSQGRLGVRDDRRRRNSRPMRGRRGLRRDL